MPDMVKRIAAVLFVVAYHAVSLRRTAR